MGDYQSEFERKVRRASETQPAARREEYKEEQEKKPPRKEETAAISMYAALVSIFKKFLSVFSEQEGVLPDQIATTDKIFEEATTFKHLLLQLSERDLSRDIPYSERLSLAWKKILCGVFVSFFDFFRETPEKGIPADEKTLLKYRYRYWRVRIFYSMYVGYIFFYFTRNSFNTAKIGLIDTLGFSLPELGLFTTVFAFAYGVSKFISGIISDRSNPRYFMAAGLIMTGALNIYFGFSTSFYLLLLIWALNGWFQGWGWPPCAKLLTHWYSHSERGRWWGLWNSAHNVGAILIPLICAFVITVWGWHQ